MILPVRCCRTGPGVLVTEFLVTELVTVVRMADHPLRRHSRHGRQEGFLIRTLRFVELAHLLPVSLNSTLRLVLGRTTHVSVSDNRSTFSRFHAHADVVNCCWCCYFCCSQRSRYRRCHRPMHCRRQLVGTAIRDWRDSDRSCVHNRGTYGVTDTKSCRCLYEHKYTHALRQYDTALHCGRKKVALT